MTLSDNKTIPLEDAVRLRRYARSMQDYKDRWIEAYFNERTKRLDTNWIATVSVLVYSGILAVGFIVMSFFNIGMIVPAVLHAALACASVYAVVLIRGQRAETKDFRHGIERAKAEKAAHTAKMTQEFQSEIVRRYNDAS